MFIVLLLLRNQNWKFLAHYSWDISLGNLATKFNKVFSSTLFKNKYKKAKLKKRKQKKKTMQATPKLLEIAKGRRIISKKEEEKPKMRKRQTGTINISFTVTPLCWKIDKLN